MLKTAFQWLLGRAASGAARPLVSGRTVAGVGVTAAAGAGAVGVDVAQNGAEGWVGDVIQAFNQTPGEAGARAGAAIGAEKLYAILEQIGKAISGMSLGLVKEDWGLGIQNWARGMQGLDPITAVQSAEETGQPAAPAPDAAAGGPGVDTGLTTGSIPGVDTELTTGGITTAVVEDRGFWGDLGHYVHVAGDSLAGVFTDIVSLPAQGLDLLDDASGALINWTTGVDTGYGQRDMSQDFHAVVDRTIHSVLPRAEIEGTVDALISGGIDIASYVVVPGGALRVVGDVAQVAEDYRQTGNAFASFSSPAPH